jgi:hypothetical protein
MFCVLNWDKNYTDALNHNIDKAKFGLKATSNSENLLLLMFYHM